MHSSIDPDRVVILTGSQKNRVKTFKASNPDSVFITNYESLLMKELYDLFILWRPEVMVADESQRIKSPTANRTKLALQLSNGIYDKRGTQVVKPAKYKYIMTGTPVLNSIMDLFTQYKFMDDGATFGSNFFYFRMRYFYDRNAGMPTHKYFPDWQLRPGSLEEINKKIFERGIHVDKKQCLDLPPFVTTIIKVKMTLEQTRLYEAMKKDCVAYIGNTAATAPLAITKTLRLMQITSDFLSTEDRIIELKGSPKMDALKELLIELAPDHKIIVWASWSKNYEQIRRLCDDLKIGCSELTGETPASKRDDNIDSFKHDNSCRVLIANPGAAGIGINLVCSDISIFFSRTFSLEHSLQAEARNYRGGSEIHEKVTRYDLVVEDTIDEHVVRALNNKQEISFEVLKNILQ